jgi:hypothetical protein
MTEDAPNAPEDDKAYQQTTSWVLNCSLMCLATTCPAKHILGCSGGVCGVLVAMSGWIPFTDKSSIFFVEQAVNVAKFPPWGQWARVVGSVVN